MVLKERAELEEQRQRLVEEMGLAQKMLKGLEDDLLYRLANSTGNLLDDTSLIEVLQQTKVPLKRILLIAHAPTHPRVKTPKRDSAIARHKRVLLNIDYSQGSVIIATNHDK